jgi:hypothetical protein
LRTRDANDADAATSWRGCDGRNDVAGFHRARVYPRLGPTLYRRVAGWHVRGHD